MQLQRAQCRERRIRIDGRALGRRCGSHVTLLAILARRSAIVAPVIATALAATLIAGCASPEEEGTPGAAPSGTGKKFLSLGTAPPGGAFFVVGGALAEVLDENRGANGWSITAEATKGTQENIRRLSRGELDLALANASITYFAIRGEEGWEQKHDVKNVMTLAPNVALFLTPKRSGLRDLAMSREVDDMLEGRASRVASQAQAMYGAVGDPVHVDVVQAGSDTPRRARVAVIARSPAALRIEAEDRVLGGSLDAARG